MKNSSLTIRGVLIGIVGLLFITVSSLYVALRLGALPWPTVFVTVLSMVLLKRAKGSTLQEVTTTHTLMSAGSMVAGGIAFTLPGLWMLDPNSSVSILSVISASVCGALLGTAFTYLYRDVMLIKEKLPYPIGEAAYKTLITIKDKKSGWYLFPSLSFSALFTFLRDFWGKIPAVLPIIKGSAYTMPLTLYVSPMAFAIGSIIGTKLVLVWLIGMVLGYYILTPIGISAGWFENLAVANNFRSDLGLGIMIGLGVAVVIKAVYDIIKGLVQNRGNREKIHNFDSRHIAVLSASIFSILVLALLGKVGLWASILTVIGAAMATYLSSMLTGQTGINPMEVFAILVVLLVKVLSSANIVSLFVIAVAVAVAAGLSGDVMNDFKSGSLVETPLKDQVIAELIGGVLGAIAATIAFFAIKNVYTLGSDFMPSPQAKAVAATLGGLNSPLAFWLGVGIGAILFFVKIPSSALGLGMYLGTNITTMVALGCLVSFIVKKVWGERGEEKGTLISSGLLGGEGFAGVIISFLSFAKL